MDLSQQLRIWAEQLSAIAREGAQAHGGGADHARRYASVAQIAQAIATAQAHEALAAARIPGQGGSPDVCGSGAIFNRQGEILLVQRREDALWALPGGLIALGETPAEGLCRQIWEETGIVARPLLLVGIYDSRRLAMQAPRQSFQIVFLCQPAEAESQAVVIDETLAARYFATDQLPPLAPGQATGIGDAARAWEGQRVEAAFL